MSEKNVPEESSQMELNLRIRNLLRLFIDSVKDYEHECGESICKDDRESLELVDIFLDSEDAFDYTEIMKLNSTK